MKYLKRFIINFRIAKSRGKSFKEAWSDAVFITNIMKGSSKKKNPYTYMGSVGVSPTHFKMYEDSIKKIKEFERD